MTADARDLLVPVAGEDVVLRARLAGDLSAPALLLLHGLGEDLEAWWERGWAQELSRRRRVIAFDARGHGASSKPHEPARYATRARIADATAVLDAAGCDAADVVGYSMGGWTPMVLAADATERVRSLVVGGAPATGQSLEPLRRALARSLESVLAAVERQCGPLPETARGRFLANDRAALAALCSEDRPALIEALAGFTGLALLYVGGRDPLRAAVAASARRPSWQCRIIEGRDHFDLAVTGAALPVVVDFLVEADASPRPADAPGAGRDVAVRIRHRARDTGHGQLDRRAASRGGWTITSDDAGAGRRNSLDHELHRPGQDVLRVLRLRRGRHRRARPLLEHSGRPDLSGQDGHRRIHGPVSSPPSRSPRSRDPLGCHADLVSTLAGGRGATSPFRRGDPIDRFTVLETLGMGGMGVVVSAHDVALDRKVAIKVVRPDRLAAEPEQGRARLLREAQAMARVSHPNVLTVHEVGTVDQDVFVVMEFVEGETLAAWMAGGPRPWRDVVRMFERAGRGLAAAHRAGLIHRDFKPENVLVTADGEVRVADFGLALSPGCRSAPTATALALSLTRTGSVLGTPIYMSPEQHRGEEVDARSDQFSFCVALYEALCGCRPFAGDSSGELLAAITERRLTAPVRAVARWLRAAVHRGLRPLPADRWPDMEALVDALSRDPARTRRPWLVRCGDAPPPRPRPSLRRRSRCE